MNARRNASLVVILVASVAASTLCAQQPKRPVADVTAVAPTTRVAPGREARLDLKVKLPAKVHVQSNKPSDPLFIPTVLTVDAPNGVTIAEIVYPPSEKLKQEGLKDPLIVFGSEFTLGVRVKIAADAKPGELIVPAKLRYQACDETTCYPPANATAKWSVQVGKS